MCRCGFSRRPQSYESSIFFFSFHSWTSPPSLLSFLRSSLAAHELLNCPFAEFPTQKSCGTTGFPVAAEPHWGAEASWRRLLFQLLNAAQPAPSGSLEPRAHVCLCPFVLLVCPEHQAAVDPPLLHASTFIHLVFSAQITVA